jgi:integrase/recombinase XerD
MVKPRLLDPHEACRSGSLQELIAGYLADLARKNYSPETVSHRRCCLLLFADWLAERAVTDAATITRPMIERYQRWLYAYRREADDQPLSVGYQIQRVKPLELLFRWAVRAHRLPANPASDLEYPRPIRRLPAVLSPYEAEAVLAQPDVSTPLGLRDRSILETLYSTGMRRAECSRLALDDIDARQGLVRIVQGKGHKDRVIPIGARALHWLDRYLSEARPALSLLAPQERRIYLSCRGLPLTKDELTPLARGYLERAGITKPGSCHLFRHTMATALLNNGCDVRVIQEMLGHAKLDTTALYTHVGVAHLKAAHRAYHPAETAPAEAADEPAPPPPAAPAGGPASASASAAPPPPPALPGIPS